MKRYKAVYEEWCVNVKDNGEEVYKNWWGVVDTITNEWVYPPESLDGKYNLARTYAKELNDGKD